MEFHSWLLSLIHTAVTFLMSLGSYWSTLASKFQFQNVTKGLEWMPAGYYTIPMADEIHFSGMKAPLHLGLLVLEDTYCLGAIALVVSLAYSIGIKHISIYTKGKGFTELEFLHLQKKISQLLSSTPEDKSASVNIRHILSSSRSSTDDADVLNVHVVNPGDGTQALVDVTKHIASLLKGGILKQEEVTPEYVDVLLKQRLKCPDPELVLKFGSVPSTCGYLPWQMRLTEIISFPSVQSFTSAHMKKALMSFSKIEQRFGK